MTRINFENRTLFHGDNLAFLRGMNSETVHLIATDPPFNKNKEFHAAPESLAQGAKFTDRWVWERDIQDAWVDAIKDDWPGVWEVIDAANVAYGKEMGAFLCWLGVRVMEMHRVLRPDGSLYLHIDHTAHAYVKAMLDGIFGARNFRNEIVWSYRTGGVSKRWYGRKHDAILFYVKSEKSRYTFNVQKEISYNRGFKPYRFKNVQEYQDTEGRWYTLASLRDVWEINAIGRTSAERAGYPTQKPLALYERIIKTSSNPGDIVLDPFCGCATTPVAAERLGRRWVGMDIWEGAYDVVLERLKRERLAVKGKQDESLLTFGSVAYSAKPPERTDDNEAAAPAFRLKTRRPTAPWQKLTHKQIVEILAQAQAGDDNGVICVGCGRALEREFMQLGHKRPRTDGGENHILNRVLLCGPCNRRKGNALTLSGLRKANHRAGWMMDERMAQAAATDALAAAEEARERWPDLTMPVGA